MSAFLFKTEPSEYAYADLERERRTVWSGVSNALALIHLRKVRADDTILVYHTGAERAVVGVASAASDSYPDPALGDPKRVVVDLVPDRPLGRPVTLAEIQADPLLRTLYLVRISRLSIMPVSAAQLGRLERLAARPAAAPRPAARARSMRS